MEKIIIIKETMFNFFTTITQDIFMFWFLQIMISIFFIIAVLKNKDNGGGTVRRGDESTKNFYHFAVFFITITLAVIFDITEAINGYKIFFYLIDISIILYLSLWNDWFRNKIVGWSNKIKNKEEKH
jgi:uncharacterized membrane protein